MAIVPFGTREDAAELVAPGERSAGGLRRAVDDLFDRFMRDAFGPADLMGPAWAGGLNVDMSESDDDVTVKVEVPGIEPKDLEINVTGNALTIRGEKKAEREEKRRSYHFVERKFGSFQRSIQLPASVNADKVDAKFQNGVVTVTLPKRPDAKPKRIPIRNG